MAVTAVAFLAGMAAAMGLGGGSFLIIYLTVFAGVSQQAAQGINLVFFMILIKNRSSSPRICFIFFQNRSF